MSTTTLSRSQATRFAAHDPTIAPCPACGAIWVKVPKKRRTWEKRHITECEYLEWLDAREAVPS